MYDIEQSLKELEAHLKSNYISILTALQSKKTLAGDPLDLPAIDTEAWLLQGLDDRFMNYPVSVIYGLENIAPVSAGTATLKTVKFFIEFLMPDNRSDTKGLYRLARFVQAAENMVNKGGIFSCGTVEKIETITPFSFRLNEASEEIRVGGVSFTMSFM